MRKVETLTAMARQVGNATRRRGLALWRRVGGRMCVGVVCGVFGPWTMEAGTGEDAWLLVFFLLFLARGVCSRERDVMQAYWYMLIRKPRVDTSRVRVPGENNDWLPEGWATQADTRIHMHAFTPLPMAVGGVFLFEKGNLIRKKRRGAETAAARRPEHFLKQSLLGSALCIYLYSRRERTPSTAQSQGLEKA